MPVSYRSLPISPFTVLLIAVLLLCAPTAPRAETPHAETPHAEAPIPEAPVPETPSADPAAQPAAPDPEPADNTEGPTGGSPIEKSPTPSDSGEGAPAAAQSPDSEEEEPQTPPSATTVVEALHDGLIGVMREAEVLGYQGRFDRLEPLVVAAYDTDFMGSKAAGRHWRSLEPEDRERWLALFRRLTIATYADRFVGYSEQRFETRGQEDGAAGTVAVRTELINPAGDDVHLNYRLRSTETGWKIIDVYMHGTVSELALRRAEYGSALDREGFEAVITSLTGKIDGYGAQSGD